MSDQGDRVALIVNPTKCPDVEELTGLLRQRCAEAGLAEPQIVSTTAEDPGQGPARSFAQDGVDLVIAAGGDGTVRAVAQALSGTGSTLGVLPLGTGNLLARNLGIPLESPQALDVALTGRTLQMDVGCAQELDEGRGEVFTVMAGLGLDATMMQEAPAGLKKLIGWPAYLVGAVRALRRGRLRVEVVVDGQPAVRRRARSVLVGNVGRLQAGVQVIPDAEPDDGLLDVAVIAPSTPLELVAVLWALVSGRRTSPRDRRITRLRGRSVHIRSGSPADRQLDGEAVDRGRELTVEVLAGALAVRVPQDGPWPVRSGADAN